MNENKSPVGRPGGRWSSKLDGQTAHVDYTIDPRTGQQIPIAYGELVSPGHLFCFMGNYYLNKNWKFMVTNCPYCGGKHWHGWPGPDVKEDGTRLSHCIGRKVGRKFPTYTGGGEYFLKLEDEK